MITSNMINYKNKLYSRYDFIQKIKNENKNTSFPELITDSILECLMRMNYASWVKETDFLTLEEMINRKYLEIHAARKTAESSGFDYNGTHIATDETSVLNIARAKAYADVHPDYVFDWQVDASTFVQFSADQVKEIDMKVSELMQSCFTKQSELVAQAKAATTKEELEAIKWPDGGMPNESRTV